MGCRPPPESGGQPVTPRRLAAKALIHQEQAGYANLVLDAELKKCAPPLDSRDAAFAARIFYTTLERLPLLDYRINQFTKKKNIEWGTRCFRDINKVFLRADPYHLQDLLYHTNFYCK